jgi:hypothetical protein
MAFPLSCWQEVLGNETKNQNEMESIIGWDRGVTFDGTSKENRRYIFLANSALVFERQADEVNGLQRVAPDQRRRVIAEAALSLHARISAV